MDQPKKYIFFKKKKKRKNEKINKKKIENDARDTNIRKRKRIGGLLPAIEGNPSGERERDSEIVKGKTLFFDKGSQSSEFWQKEKNPKKKKKKKKNRNNGKLVGGFRFRSRFQARTPNFLSLSLSLSSGNPISKREKQ
jgi:hypothetical protein